MPTLQSVITLNSTLSARQEAFWQGWHHAAWNEWGEVRARCEDIWAHTRGLYGFKDVPTPLLTPPSANMKLDKTVSFGLTIQSHVTTLADGTRVNACTSAGTCVKVCVLNNGNGAYPRVQRARDAKTDFLAHYPSEFLFLLGYELAKAVGKHGRILFRPNVNSDLNWRRILGDILTNGVDGAVESYDYTKHESVFDESFQPYYVRAYSLNEHSDLGAVQEFLRKGGNVAVVTNRRKGQDVEQWAHKLGLVAPVVDADKTDAWMLPARGVIGDLSAKGKARSLIGKSDFVRVMY